MSNQPVVCFSLTEEEYAALAKDGPRRDIPLLAALLGAELIFRKSASKRRGIWGKLAGPQVRHAWDASRRASSHGTVFADGEHVGFPLAAFLALRNKRNVRLVILGHFVDKPWKRFMLRCATRLVPQGTLVLHSTTQAERLGSRLPRTWNLRLIPYQVDTAFWHAPQTEPQKRLIVSAGSENRDYETLMEAVRDLDVEVCIASGSHWARAQASAASVPANVRFLTETLSFVELRQLYSRAELVVVPLHPVSNQSGITTILEAMSMGKPSVVTATPGQREVVAGPVILGDGERVADDQRGPHLFGFDSTTAQTGLYVPPADPAALRSAILEVLDNSEAAREIGATAREVAVKHFSVEAFGHRFAELIASAKADSAEPALLGGSA